MNDGDGQQSGPRPEGESTMSGLKSVFRGAAVASGLALPIISSSQPTAAPIRLDGQTLDPGIQAMLANDKVKEEAAKGKPGNDPNTAAGMKAIRHEANARWAAGTAAAPADRQSTRLNSSH